MSAPAKPKYRTTNWKDYNTELKARASLLIWLDKDMCWHGSASGKRGRHPKYSEAAIQFCLSIKGLFNLVLRQAMGMAQSLLKLAGLDWQVLDFSTFRAPEASAGDDRSAADYNGIAPPGRQHGHQDAGRRRVEDQKKWGTGG